MQENRTHRPPSSISLSEVTTFNALHTRALNKITHVLYFSLVSAGSSTPRNLSNRELPIQPVIRVTVLLIALCDPLLHPEPAAGVFKCRGVYQYLTEMLRGKMY